MTKPTEINVPSDALEARRAPETLERELIFGMAKFYKFYRAMREIVCPYDPTNLSYRSDFSIDRYNVLYRAINAFYRRFDHKTETPENLGIPNHLLAGYVIDWANRNNVPEETGQRLLDEITKETEYSAALTLPALQALSESPAFADWIQGRVTLLTFNTINNQRQLGMLTLEKFETAVAAARQVVSQVGGNASDLARPIGEFQIPAEDDPGELIGPNRFLCRQAVATLVGPSGIGKSTLAMQMAMAFALGKNIFGFQPKKPMKILIIQGENDNGDIAEMRDGTVTGLALTEEEKATVSSNVLCCRCNSTTGKKFIHGPVRMNLQRLKPDLLIIDPALCYVGGDTKEQKVVGEFLRTLLLPELQKADCSCLLLHHTNKPPTQNPKGGSSNDDAYAESGSAEFRNVARAVITLRPMGDGTVFELRVPKRGNRLGWKDEMGQPTTKKYIRHAADRKKLFWEETTEAGATSACVAAQDQKLDAIAEMVLNCVPNHGEISQNDLIAAAKTHGIGNKACRDAIKVLLAESSVQSTKKPRPGARPGICYSRVIKTSIPGGEPA